MTAARTFRLFISSTFRDFKAEREALQERVFPELEEFCRLRGATFQAIDLRWGITEEAQREHETMRICLEELRRCQELSPKPNFVALLGNRYGWEPAPARIPADHWNRLISASRPSDCDLIRSGYIGPDLNAVPPVYHLRKREGSQASCVPRENLLRDALRQAADAAGFCANERIPYFGSATHQEIALGALAAKDAAGRDLHPEDHVHVYLRRIADLPQSTDARDFLDWDEINHAPTAGAAQRLDALKTELKNRLPGCVREFSTRWIGGGIENNHLEEFCECFLEDQKAIIQRELESAMIFDETQSRDNAHANFAIERARNFQGRVDILGCIERHINDFTTNGPLIICGEGGTGKSALMAQAFQNACAAAGQSEVIARFIGGAPGTDNLYDLLTTLTADIASKFDRPKPPLAASITEALKHFHWALSLSNAAHPLVLFVDALDQLNGKEGALLLELLPKLVLHTRLVVSGRREKLPLGAGHFLDGIVLELPPMSPVEGRQMLQAWLDDTREASYNAGIAHSNRRALTAPQSQAILDIFAETGKPLWLKLAYEEARRWPSWHGDDDPKSLELPETIKGMVQDLINRRLVRTEKHPAEFTRKALAYIAAGRFGLSDEELGWALATDPVVRCEFEKDTAATGSHWEYNEKLPPIIWSRLYSDLQPYLSQVSVDGAVLHRWFHREFQEEIERTLIVNEAQRQEIHGHLARVFHIMAPYGDDLYRYTESGSSWQVAAQRRVSEQPWQLARAGMQDALMSLLTDFGFCMGKCAARLGDDLIRDIVDLLNLTPHVSSHQRWIEFLLSVGHLLRSDLNAWPGHRILLQLALEEPLLECHGAIEAWSERQSNWAVVRSRVNITSGEKSFPLVVFEGHTGPISGVLELPDNRLLSWSSRDPNVRVWNIISGETVEILRHEQNVIDVEIAAGARILSSSLDQTLKVWSSETGNLISSYAVWASSRLGVGGFRSIDAERFAHWAAANDPTDYTIGIRSLQSGALCASLPRPSDDGHTDLIKGVLPLDDGTLLSWSHDQTVRRWDLNTGECLAVTADLQAPIVSVKLLADDAIRVVTWRADFGAEPVTLDVCRNTLQPLKKLRAQPSFPDLVVKTANVLSTDRGQLRWQGTQIFLYPSVTTQSDTRHLDECDTPATPAPQSTSIQPLELTKLKVLANDKILAGLSDASLALIDPETGLTLDRLKGRGDCAGSGCFVDEETLAIWTTTSQGKNLLRIWRPGSGSKIEKHSVPHGRIQGAEPVPEGLLTWGYRTVSLWKMNPLRLGVKLVHPAEVIFLRRADRYAGYVSCDREGNIALWHGADLERVQWIHTNLRGVLDALPHEDGTLLVLYKDAGRRVIKGFSIDTGAPIGLSRSSLQARQRHHRKSKKPILPGVDIDENAIYVRVRGKVMGAWFNRGGSMNVLSMTRNGTIVAQRDGELLLIYSHVSPFSLNGALTIDDDRNSDHITASDLSDLHLIPEEPHPSEVPKPWPAVFGDLRKWLLDPRLASLDTPSFKGKTWMGGGVLVLSVYSPRAEQDSRMYRNRSWAHVDRYCLITQYPKAINRLLREMTIYISPSTFMDKDNFYRDVAIVMDKAEKSGEDLDGILSAGIARAEEIVNSYAGAGFLM